MMTTTTTVNTIPNTTIFITKPADESLKIETKHPQGCPGIDRERKYKMSWLNPDTETRMNELFSELVPDSGKAESKAGEIIRATSRIGYRWFNDGDMVNRGYGKETCNAAARFLMNNCNHNIEQVLSLMGHDGYISDEDYSDLLEELCEEVILFVDENPGLREAPTEDMFDWFNEDEDRDDSYDEEDEEEFEYDCDWDDEEESEDF